MLTLGSLPLGQIPRTVVSFSDNVTPHHLKDAKRQGLDIVEIRIDLFSSVKPTYVTQQIQQFDGFPTSATIRCQSEGGKWTLSEGQRLLLFQSIISHVDAIDIELLAKDINEQVIRAAHEAKKLVLVSYHNLATTLSLSELTSMVERATSLKADIVKIATATKTVGDLRALARLTLDGADRHIVVIAMGAHGVSSRILFPALGSLMTYASIGKPTAPGQLPLHVTVDMLRKLYPRYNEEKIHTLKLIESP